MKTATVYCREELYMPEHDDAHVLYLSTIELPTAPSFVISFYRNKDDVAIKADAGELHQLKITTDEVWVWALILPCHPKDDFHILGDFKQVESTLHVAETKCHQGYRILVSGVPFAAMVVGSDEIVPAQVVMELE